MWVRSGARSLFQCVAASSTVGSATRVCGDCLISASDSKWPKSKQCCVRRLVKCSTKLSPSPKLGGNCHSGPLLTAGEAGGTPRNVSCSEATATRNVFRGPSCAHGPYMSVSSQGISPPHRSTLIILNTKSKWSLQAIINPQKTLGNLH